MKYEECGACFLPPSHLILRTPCLPQPTNLGNAMIRFATVADAAAICGIYNHYIETTRITFEEAPLAPEEVAARVASVTQDYPWFVCEEEGRVIGYAYATRWKERSAYRYSVEAAIYLDRERVGKGAGTALLTRLLDELRNRKIHSVISGIALPNAASVALCEKLGFVKIGQFREVGYKFGQWVDVGYWELVLE